MDELLLPMVLLAIAGLILFCFGHLGARWISCRESVDKLEDRCDRLRAENADLKQKLWRIQDIIEDEK